MSDLTMRSKIRVYWTTNPADFGYDGQPTGGVAGAWKTGKGFELCSVRKAATFAYDLSQRVGQGVWKSISYQHNGAEIELRDLQAIIDEADIPAAYR